jgi:protein-L-isoaspartate(D-aspartate) O-methyltransferase
MIKLRSRERLVNEIEQHLHLDSHVKEALLSVDREIFVPSEFRHFAYKLDALPLSASQWISSPLTVAKMTQYLDLKGATKVLEIGCGSGYQSAVLSKIVHRVFTIERIDELLKGAKYRFQELGFNNILARFDDGQRGWKQYAPYDRILLSATAKTIPDTLFEQLVDGGILVAPIELNASEHIITRFVKNGDSISSEELESARFVPILDGTQK